MHQLLGFVNADENSLNFTEQRLSSGESMSLLRVLGEESFSRVIISMTNSIFDSSWMVEQKSVGTS